MSLGIISKKERIWVDISAAVSIMINGRDPEKVI
jgi:hypothetical protein